ncbi:hypothetical protein AYO20_08013 [Fonsecaea nubica]|uniref:Uncharacterized protein n=1 Tax=Fonsecaea nubica TaxID=856822 RepID=A0A178CT24_9EURO|nr:hypothetical protein AYO20_08013 [Fonsecaea nubica]OAL32075.1 hypothetical protein AYO20_08013 [Fonsecaea nubica]
MHVGQTSKLIIPGFLNGYTMYISGESDAGSYGRLVSWDDADDAFMLMQSGLSFSQERSFSFWNVTNVNACRQAELDRLWKVVDEHFQKHTDETLYEIFLSHDGKAREIRRTPEWTPPSKVSQLNNKGKEKEALSDSFSRLNVEPDKPSSFKEPGVFRAPKIKTRGLSPLPDSSEATRALPDDSTPPFPVFTLPRSAYKVFAFLFLTSSSPSHGGEIAWTDFLHTMTSIGFAAEKLYGSVWQFTPQDGLDWENTNTRGIHIHEPHPTPKMGLGTARRVERRLERRYGLSAERFALA